MARRWLGRLKRFGLFRGFNTGSELTQGRAASLGFVAALIQVWL